MWVETPSSGSFTLFENSRIMGCGIGAPGQQLKAPDLSATSDRQWLGWAPVFCDFSVSIVIYYNFFQTIKYLKLHCILRLICLVIEIYLVTILIESTLIRFDNMVVIIWISEELPSVVARPEHCFELFIFKSSTSCRQIHK